MPISTGKNRFQWMVSVGVNQNDVNWLGHVGRVENITNPSAMMRVKEIQQKTYEGLLATMSPVVFLDVQPGI